jgi:tripartite-type tricarboxylate transporter receptor subunit TctC
MIITKAARTAVTIAFALAASAAAGQEYPVKPIRVLIGFSPGGGADLVTRTVSPAIAESIAQQLIIDNRPGANGIIAAELAAKSPPDGYTLLAAPGNYAFAPALVSKLPFNMATAFAAVAQLVDSPLLLVVHPSLPARNVKELIAIAKARPGELSYASGGVGGSAHLATELFRAAARVNLVHIAYKGTGPALNDLIAGHVPVCFCTLPSTLPHAKSGRLRALAVTTPKRSGAAPEIPTVAEAGVPGYQMSQWYGMLAPAATPPAIVDRLNAEIRKALKRPQVRSQLLAAGADPVESSPQEFAAFFSAEIARWTRVVQAAGIRAE